jgi:hypothetical protein
MLTRTAFDEARETARRVAGREGRVLALISVLGGLAQLAFLRWAETYLARGPRLAIAGTAFVIYMLVVVLLLVRMRRRIRQALPVCGSCGARLDDNSLRIAAATGRCDTCGGAIIIEDT